MFNSNLRKDSTPLPQKVKIGDPVQEKPVEAASLSPPSPHQTKLHTHYNVHQGNTHFIKSALWIGKCCYYKCISEMLNICVKGYCIYEMFCIIVMNWNQ